MKLNSIISVIGGFLFLGCKNTGREIPSKEQEMATVYVLDSVPKTKLILRDDSTFEFIKINQNYYKYMFDRIDLSFFMTSGNWRIDGDHLILNSNSDSSALPTVDLRLDTARNLKYSTFRFYDIYNDSVASWQVDYPNGNSIVEGSDLQDHIFEWAEDMTKIKSLEFVFTGYGRWKYSSPDGENHNVSVHFSPLRRGKYFEDKKLKIQNDTLIDYIEGRNYYFIKRGK